MDSSDSRKRPLDGENESGVPKRSNPGLGDTLHLKMLIPATAAGAIIGKGGETIMLIQKESGANIKMSKANDYYPGTTERVCLITGSLESVKQVYLYVMDKVRGKPEGQPVDLEMKVKILVPNSTAGMIIGKAGGFIRHVKEESGSYVQVSQKAKDMNLPERCVTIAGEHANVTVAMDMILQKLLEDPQSSSCPNISYADYRGPLASTNPTGSPYASGFGGGMGNNGGGMGGGGGGMGGGMGAGGMAGGMGAGGMAGGMGGGGSMGAGGGGVGLFGNIGNGINNLNLNAGGSMLGNPAFENLRATLRSSGYTEQATEEISAAMCTLANYGFLGLGLGLGGLANLGGGPGFNFGNMANQNPGGNLTLGSLAGILGGGGGTGGGGGAGNAGGSLLGNKPGAGGGSAEGGVFGPVGNTTTTMAGGDTGAGAGSYYGAGGGEHYPGGESLFGAGPTYNQGGYSASNQNSFGLGTGIGSFAAGSGDGTGEEASTEKEMEVGEHIVGAIIGPGGRGIVELQKFTGANIQISKKGVYAPGTQNRVVTITGNTMSVQRAEVLIQQRIVQEQTKRSRQGQNAR